MSNMSYCRFLNTSRDLDDCVDNWDTLESDDKEELQARERIIRLAKRIVEMQS